MRTACGYDEPFVGTVADVLQELADVAGYPVRDYWEMNDTLYVYQPDPQEEAEKVEQAWMDSEMDEPVKLRS